MRKSQQIRFIFNFSVTSVILIDYQLIKNDRCDRKMLFYYIEHAFTTSMYFLAPQNYSEAGEKYFVAGENYSGAGENEMQAGL